MQAVKELALLLELDVGLVSVLPERHPAGQVGGLQADRNAIRGLVALCWRAAALQRAFHADKTGVKLAATPTYCSHEVNTEPQKGRLVTHSEMCPLVCLLPCSMPDQIPRGRAVLLSLLMFPLAGCLHKLSVTLMVGCTAED